MLEDDLMIFQNLVKNSSFEAGILEPWKGNNTYITSKPCPDTIGDFSAFLTQKNVTASVEQIINVVPGESYHLSISLAAHRIGISPKIKIVLEFLDLSGQPIGDGIHIRLQKGQLSNWFRKTVKTIHQNSLIVPAGIHFAKLTIMKIASSFTTGVIIDNVALTRIKEDMSLPTAYVANSGTNIVSVVGDNPNAIVVGEGPVAMVKATVNDNSFIYVANEDGTVSVIQASDNTVVATINLPGEPSFQFNRNILINSDESTVYVANYDSSENTGYVSVIDTATNTLTTSIMVQSDPITMALTHDEQSNSGLLYVINNGSHSISVIDTANNTIADNFSIKDASPRYLVITLDNQYFIIGYSDGKYFHVGEVSTNTIIKSVKHSGTKHLKSLTLSLDSTLVYAGYKVNKRTDKDGAALKPYKIYDDFAHGPNTELGYYRYPAKPEMVVENELTDDYTAIYVSLVDSGNDLYEIVREVATNTFTIMTHLDIDSFTGFFALSSDKNYIVTTNTNDSVSYIDTATLSIIETFNVQSDPKVLILLDS